MREGSNIRELVKLKPDYMGLIFYPASSRYAGNADPNVLSDLPDDIILTGVFVNGSESEILQAITKYNLKAVQLHGNETPEFCSSLRETVIQNNIHVQIIKAFGIDDEFEFDILEGYLSVVDYFLFDTRTAAYGGSGKKFSWEILNRYRLDKPYFLSGGIGLSDLSELKLLADERLYALDINSRFEISPALKDIGEVGKAIDIIRKTTYGTRVGSKTE